MADKWIEVLVMEGIAVLMLWFAYMIGVRGRLELIAGYNERSAARVRDKAGLKRLIARTCLLVGIASALMPALTHIVDMAYAIGGYGGFIAGVIGMVMLQARDYAV